jgi:aryl-alcohol dehydrogenase-like predicted oxidoreductase
MKYKKLGNTGLLVSELCLGTMTFGGKGFWEVIGKQGQQVVNSLISRSLEAGINFIDTANVYSEGESERLLGIGLKELQVNREDIVLATKVRGKIGAGPNQVGLSRFHIMNEVEKSLQRLQTDYIDLYQIHGFDPVTPLDETLRALDDLVRQGKVRYLGCSNLMAWQIMKAIGISEFHGWNRFESLQAYYSVAGRELEREIVPLLKDQKLGLMVWSPLAGGFLSGKFKRNGEGQQDARRTTFDFPPVDKERAFDVIEVMEKIGEAKGVSVARIALAWLLYQEAVTSVIIGAKTIEQLNDNLAAVDVQLSTEEIKQLNDVSKIPMEYPQWMVERQSADRK